MDLRQIMYFMCVYEESSFTGAVLSPSVETIVSVAQ